MPLLGTRIQILSATPPACEGEVIWDTIGSSQRPRRGEPQMQYHQITSGERYAIAALRKRKLSIRAIGVELGRSASTVSREVRRNLSTQGRYSPPKADSYAVARRRRSRRNSVSYTHLTLPTILRV